MKMPRLRLLRVCASLWCQQSFALSGTPIENHLESCGLSFKLCFRSYQVKRSLWNWPADRVAQFIKPFVMRRKKEVLTELPDLIEVVYKMNWRSAVAIWRNFSANRCEPPSVTDQEFQRSRVEILSGLMRLRQICDTPALLWTITKETVNWIVSEICCYKCRWWASGLDFLSI